MRTAARLAVGLVCFSCTRPNPAYWPVTGGDAELMPEPLPPDAAAIAEPDAALLALDTADPPADLAPPAADRAVGDQALADVLPPDTALPRDLGPDGSPAACGTGAADVSGIMNADGVAIDDDGTIFVLTDDSTHSYVGRLRPGEAFKQNWRRIDNAPSTWGLALDRKNRKIYVAEVSGGAIVMFDDIDGAAPGSKLVTGLEDPNDVVVGNDGSVYYSNQGDRSVYRVGPGGGPRGLVSTNPFGDGAMGQMPSALAIDPAGNLIVGLEPSGPVYRVTLNAAGLQTSRTAIPGWNGWANGLTYDRSGRLYVGIYHDTQTRSVVRLEPDGRITTIATGGRFSSIAFGRGALDCHDLYITDPYAAMRRVRVNDAF